jgi:ClpP class serine protease
MFIDLVKRSRGARLKDHDDLFTGAYWTGPKSIELGLADAIGDLRSVLRGRFGDKVKTPVIASNPGLLSGLLGRRTASADALLSLGGNLPEEALATLEGRAIWARFGL